MEMNFDKHIKDSMDNFELPYDSSAWDKMNAHLDQTMPVAPKSTTKWWIATTIATVALISTTYLMTSTPTDNSVAKNEPSSEKINPNIVETTNTSSDGNSNTISTSNPAQTEQLSESKELINENTSATSTKVDSDKEIVEQHVDIKNTDNTKANNINKSYVFLPIDNVCLGNAVTIKNTNPSDIVLMQPNGKKTIINAHDNLYLGASIAGEYELGYMRDGAFIMKEKFTVYPTSVKAEIEIGEFEYEDGLPTIRFKSDNSASNYEWTVNKKHISSNKETEAHLFEKGTYEIKLTTTSNNGCTSTVTEKVTVAEKYNLGTPADFGLDLSSESKHKTFIPGALKARNVRFTMNIIDPINGAVIYQTNDASQPWDGTDSRTGNQVQNTSYVWTVKILNPEQGEDADYKGVIIIKL